jgi:adenylate kinase family enzyme
VLKLHITGLAGSGKTTLARWASDEFGMPAVDLDHVVYTTAGERPRAELLAQLDAIRSRDQWITEGAYHDAWLNPLLADASAIVWLDPPLAVCLARMVRRHIAAELRGNNQHPGWRKLWRFLNYTRRTATAQRSAVASMLHPHAAKVHHCRSSRDVQRLKVWLAKNG